MSSGRILGNVRSGWVAPVVFGAYSGEAGLRGVPDGIEMAFMGVQPSTSMPIMGRIDGRPARAVKRLKSEIPDMHVFIVELID